MKTVGATVMGARTYQLSLKNGWLTAGTKTYVLSRHQLPPSSGAEVEFYSGPLPALIEQIRQATDKNIYVVGGGQVVSSFINAGLIDELLIFVARLVQPYYAHQGKYIPV
jgi:dihydrofolate reductase